MIPLALLCDHPARTAAWTELLMQFPNTAWQDSTQLPTDFKGILLCDLEKDTANIKNYPEAHPLIINQPHAKTAELTRPLRWAEVAAKLQLMITQHDTDNDFEVGPYICSPLDRCLYDEQGLEKSKLTEKEVDLLRTILQLGATKQATRATLLGRVWGYKEALETHTLETHIYRLRQKLEDDPTTPKILVTLEHGYGIAPYSSAGKSAL